VSCPKARPKVIYVVIEIPKRSRNKYEYDEEGLFLKLDRVLFSSLYYPGDYGFIAQTLAEDGAPLDVLVMGSGPTFGRHVVLPVYLSPSQQQRDVLCFLAA